MNTRKILIFIAAFVFVFSGCIAPEPHTVSVPETTFETVSESVSETDETETGTERFLGRLTDKRILDINRKTAETSGSNVTDVTIPKPLDVRTLSEMMQRFTFPEQCFLGDHPLTEEEKNALYDNRNLPDLLKALKSASSPLRSPSFGILTQNASVRLLPTEERVTQSGGEAENDRLQESFLPIATGVQIYAESMDGKYYFAVGENDYGYVLKTSVALTDYETFLQYLTTDLPLVTVCPDLNDPYDRLGRILPIEQTKIESGVEIAEVRFPVRTVEGDLSVEIRRITLSGIGHHVGFLAFSPEAVSSIARSMISTPYGWGDQGNFYDCSSFAGAIYRCFGLIVPRNSADFACFGGDVLNLEGKTEEEKRAFLRESVGGFVLFPGHVMVISESDPEKTVLIHAVKGWYNTAHEYIDARSVAETDVDELFDAGGRSWIDRFTKIVRFRP